MARAYLYLPVRIPLLAVLALELVALGLELAISPPRIAIMPAQRPAGRIINTAAPNPRFEAAALLARPLFSPGRRPAIAAPRPVPQPPRLSGIVVTGSGRYAIFVPDGGNPMIVAKGQLIGPFKIREITTTQVIVSGPNGSFTLHTSYPDAASGTASQAASTPSKIPAPITLPGGITLYPATRENLPDDADWPGPKD